MQTFPINYLALLVATLAKTALGAFWYSPIAFLPGWLRATGMSKEEMSQGMGTAIVLDILGNFVMAFVLVHAVHYAGATNALTGMAVGFFNWLGFVFVVLLTTVLHEKRPMQLLTINSGYQLIGMLIMGAIVAVWV